MFLRQPCPHCAHPAEFVYVQIGHSHVCKKCNTEFTLKPQKVNYAKYVAAGTGFLVAAAIGFFVVKNFHDWWIYGGSPKKEPAATKVSR